MWISTVIYLFLLWLEPHLATDGVQSTTEAQGFKSDCRAMSQFVKISITEALSSYSLPQNKQLVIQVVYEKYMQPLVATTDL